MVSFGANPFLLFFSLQTVGKPFSIQDNQLIQHLIPVPISLCPFPDYVFAGKIQHLFQCCIAWKYTLGFCDFQVLTVQSLYDVTANVIVTSIKRLLHIRQKHVKFLLHSLIAVYLACFLTTQEKYFYPRPTCIFRI